MFERDGVRDGVRLDELAILAGVIKGRENGVGLRRLGATGLKESCGRSPNRHE